MTTFWNKLIVKVGMITAVCLIVIAILIAMSFLVTPFFNRYRPNFESLATKILNRPVQIGEASLTWEIYKPEINFQNVSILDPQTHKPKLKISSINLSIAIFKSIWRRNLYVESLKIKGAHLTLRKQQTGQISMDGFNQFLITDKLTGENLNPNAILSWIFSEPSLTLEDIELQYYAYDETQKNINFKKLTLNNSLNRHLLRGEASLNQEETKILFRINWLGSIFDIAHTSANFYLNAKNIFLPQFPQSQYKLNILKGKADAEMRAAWNNNAWQNIQAELKIRNITFGIDSIFNDTLQFDQINGSLNWQRNVNGGTFLAKNLAINNTDLHVDGDLAIQFKDNESPTINLNSQFNVFNVNKISQYLPLKLFSNALQTWLRNAFLAGQLSNGKAILQGKISDFPFDNKNGKFEISGTTSNVDLNYSPKWPILKKINGNLVFSNRSMSLDAQSSTINDILLHDVHCSILNLADPVVTANTRIIADLNQGLDFIQKSPLQQTIGKNLALLQLQGPMNLMLSLSIPVLQLDNIKVIGDLSILNANLNLPQWNLHITELTGPFHFTEDTLTAEHMTGKLFNYPLTLDFTTNPAQENAVTATLQSVINISDIMKWLNIGDQDTFQGMTSYKAFINFSSQKSSTASPINVIFQSNLKGITVKLPGEFGKKSSETRDFKVILSAKKNEPIKAKLNNLNIQLSKLSDKRFILGLNNPDMSGQIIFGHSKLDEVSARFQRLIIASNRTLRLGNTLNIKNIPPISFIGDDVRFGDMQLGKVSLNLVPSNDHILIKQLNAQSQTYQLHATGNGTNTNSHLEGTITSATVSDFLKSWGFNSNNLIANKGNVDFNLNWSGGLFDPALSKLSGKVSVELGEGRIINLGESTDAKMGLGRLLNIFSLQNLPKRLSLNFNDISGKGYEFESAKGNFILQNGNAMTENARFHGTVAGIQIGGRIGLVAKDLDIILTVTPHVTASLPIAAAIATANPVVGVATLLVDKMVAPAVSHITTYKYSIKGRWDNPLWNQITASTSTPSTQYLLK